MTQFSDLTVQVDEEGERGDGGDHQEAGEADFSSEVRDEQPPQRHRVPQGPLQEGQDRR